MSEGFLGTAAPLYADIVLLLEFLMAAGLLLGGFLARQKRYRLHIWCQSLIVLVNLALIVGTMLPTFLDRVSPHFPRGLSKPRYVLATAHAALGGVTELAGLYILLAAGTRILPEQLRITRYKTCMRAVLVLWWIVFLLGLATYMRWYVPHLFPK